jgi:deoxyribodipyrimidine photo-lyase
VKPTVNIFWFRRDLRLIDNAGLFHALASGLPVIPVFVFDEYILSELEDKEDERVSFIYDTIQQLQKQLTAMGSTLHVLYGKPVEQLIKLIDIYKVNTVYTNHDYEPYAIKRDQDVEKAFSSNGIRFQTFKDQVIFERNEIEKPNGGYYSVFTPYSNKWKTTLTPDQLKPFASETLTRNFYKQLPVRVPSLSEMGFVHHQNQETWRLDEKIISGYHATRDIPGITGTTKVGKHLRFGTISIRMLVQKALDMNETFLNELIWREFFMQMLWREPRLEYECFRTEFESINWRNNEKEFTLWCQGKTGYPLVDAGMRELNATGFMHNRVRMITASFLVKHLLIDWRWGEAYFAKKLLDYELASNIGNWQWVAGCGCDAAPYFRIFSPDAQTKRFDPKGIYIRKWVPEFDTLDYPPPVVEHSFARERCLKVFKAALSTKKF